MVIELKNIHYSFTKKFKNQILSQKILKGLNFSVANEEFCIITGPSGSGKTTLLQIIATMLNQETGERIIFGTNHSNKQSIEDLTPTRRKIGYLFQQPYLPPKLKVKDFIALQAMLSGIGIKSAEKITNSLLDEFKMMDFAQQYPKKLSGGEKQRIALAGVLAKDIRLLLLDEPTGSLDSINKAIIWETITNLKGKGITIIAVTHDESIAPLADKTYELRYGVLSRN
ncbi:MAG TPA: ABC transporter ATP-binding protein [candidate division Zixibacteria bacterium]|nr:ABC transporter ATP-binding protein [candidate division Zixibacteria bacterium]